MSSKTICVDFDGVIHEFSKGWQDGSIYDPPVANAKEQLAKLVRKEYRIVVQTTRLNPVINGDEEVERQKTLIAEWLINNGFEKGVHYHEITAMKPQAVAYIDDRGLRFTNWVDVGKYMM